MTAKLRRRWFQFSLKGLMLLVVVAAIPCGWLKWEVDQKRREREAVVAIEKLGGTVWYQWQWDDLKATHPPGVPWLRRLLGDNFFTNVHFVYLDHSIDPESAISHLRDMTHLSGLSLTGSRITNNGLASVEGLSNLQQLDLNNTLITDSGLKHLKALSALKYLGISGTKTTTAAVDDLAKALPGCEIVGSSLPDESPPTTH